MRFDLKHAGGEGLRRCRVSENLYELGRGGFMTGRLQSASVRFYFRFELGVVQTQRNRHCRDAILSGKLGGPLPERFWNSPSAAKLDVATPLF